MGGGRQGEWLAGEKVKKRKKRGEKVADDVDSGCPCLTVHQIRKSSLDW